MRIAVTGSTGLVGSALVPALRAAGHEVVRLVRADPGGARDAVRWSPDAGVVPAEALEGAGAVVHLAGESIAGGRWTAARKAAIRDSRVVGTGLLAGALARLPQPPEVLVSASAVGYYGDRGDETLAEESPGGSGFLAGVAREWEAATAPAAGRGIRVVTLRLGMVLSAGGGALRAMLPPFRLGLGGVIGSGRQYVSWISLEDVPPVVLHVLATGSLQGPVNAVAPSPVTSRELTATLGRVLGRPAILPLPAAAARLLLGEMADELLLASTRVLPGRLLATGFRFLHPALEGALRAALRR
jgi:uncharacterized protein (TIGR01777 family)